MTLLPKGLGIVCAIFLSVMTGQAQAFELLHFVEAKDQPRAIEKASGLKLTDDGTVYVTSQEKGTILKIVDGKIEAKSLIP